ncbi:MAG: YkgJ family cysteine cluster protein [Acidobacteriota bacterium]|nr:YkgJ family cysteine cluster protein [Acidobacteriota bacterium]
MRRAKISADKFADVQNSLYETIWGKLFPPQILTEGLSNTVEESVITDPDAQAPDCMACGACCAAFVVVDAEDSKIPAEKLWIVDFEKKGETGRCIRRREEDFACAGLEGRVGGPVSCGVYDDRPGMCRKFEAGSDRCHAVRRAFGIEPFLTLEEMLEAKRRLEARAPFAATRLNRSCRSRPWRKRRG